jgi:hypothetical protein
MKCLHTLAMALLAAAMLFAQDPPQALQVNPQSWKNESATAPQPDKALNPTGRQPMPYGWPSGCREQNHTALS